MKKVVSLAVLVAMAAGASHAAPAYLSRDGKGGYNVTYTYTDKEKTGWSVTARAELSMLNWKNEYTFSVDGMGDFGVPSDEYSFEPIFGGSIAGGYAFNYFWRGEVELGYMGKFDDAGFGTDFGLSIPYAMANVYYDFINGLYIGAGAGVALPRIEFDSTGFAGGDYAQTNVSPMFGLMAGYALELNDYLTLDIRYRLATVWGGTYERDVDYVDASNAHHDGTFESDIGLILDNSLSIGLRYEF